MIRRWEALTPKIDPVLQEVVNYPMEPPVAHALYNKMLDILQIGAKETGTHWNVIWVVERARAVHRRN